MLNQWEITYKEDKTKTVSQTIDRASHGIASSARSRHRAPSRPGTQSAPSSHPFMPEFQDAYCAI